MSRFFNQEKLGIEEHKNYNKIIIGIETPSDSYGLNYFQQVDETIEKALSKYEKNSEPVMICLVGDFKKLKKDKFEDYKEYIFIIKNLLASHLADKDVPLEREQRLGIPKHLRGIELSDLALMSFINKEMKFSLLGIEIHDTNGKIIERVF
jgi:hypothetical protein